MMVIEPGHLSDFDLERYRARRMPRAELLASDDHLTACDQCTERLRSAAESSSALDSIEASLFNRVEGNIEHLSFEQMANLVDGELTEPDREVFDAHLAHCRQCRVEVRDLLQDKASISARNNDYALVSSQILESRPIASPHSSPNKHLGVREKLSLMWRATGFRWAIQVAAAAVIVLLAVWWVNLRLGNRLASLQSRITGLEQENQGLEGRKKEAQRLQDELEAARKENESLKQGQLIASLNDSGSNVSLDRDGHLIGLDFLSPSVQADVKTALASGQVKLPVALASLRGESGTLLGGPEAKTPYGLVEPVAMVVRSNRPRFHWNAVPGAASYELTVYGDGFKEVATSGPLSATKWISTAPLQRGLVYTWQVVTAVDGRQVVLPPAAAPRARFRVLDEPAVGNLERLERATEKSHLALGVAYARNGLLNDARREFQALVDANPDSTLAKNLLHSVDAAGAQ
jgi:hypothetical protein